MFNVNSSPSTTARHSLPSDDPERGRSGSGAPQQGSAQHSRLLTRPRSTTRSSADSAGVPEPCSVSFQAYFDVARTTPPRPGTAERRVWSDALATVRLRAARSALATAECDPLSPGHAHQTTVRTADACNMLADLAKSMFGDTDETHFVHALTAFGQLRNALFEETLPLVRR